MKYPHHVARTATVSRTIWNLSIPTNRCQVEEIQFSFSSSKHLSYSIYLGYVGSVYFLISKHQARKLSKKRLFQNNIYAFCSTVYFLCIWCNSALWMFRTFSASNGRDVEMSRCLCFSLPFPPFWPFWLCATVLSGAVCEVVQGIRSIPEPNQHTVQFSNKDRSLPLPLLFEYKLWKTNTCRARLCNLRSISISIK